MRRRYFLMAGGALFTASGVGQGVGARNDDVDANTEPDSIACAGAAAEADGAEADAEMVEFDGAGAAVTDSFELDGGLVVTEGTHDGESNFIAHLVDDERDHLVFNTIGAFEGAAGGLYDEGEYLLDVDADGEWTVTLRQPPFDEDDAESLPQTLECEGATWAGPYLFDGLTEARGTHEGESNFIVEVVAVEALFPELVFNEIGPFDGETTFRAEGVGYVITEADGLWTLELG